MMDSEVLAVHDDDLEEGELSDASDDVYTPLQRPVQITTPIPVQYVRTSSKMEDDFVETPNVNAKTNDIDDDDECQSDVSSSSSEDSSDTCLAKDYKEKKKQQKKRVKRTVMVRISPTNDSSEQKRARFKRYDIWTAALQEDALTENMRGCDVTQNGFNDRNVENYDFSLHYRLNGENSLKRRLSGDDISDSDQQQPQNKRQRPSSRGEYHSRSSSSSKNSVHERLGKRRNYRRYSSTNSGSDTNSYEPRHIEDLEEIGDRDGVEVAKEIALKLHEGKDDLLVRIVEVLGTEIPLKVFKETQRIEADGGMTIKNGQRRRTPGGVFLFLIKHNDTISAEDQKAIFSEDRFKANKKNKDIKTIMRERKVEELKKRLSEQGAELNSLATRKDLMLMGEELLKEQEKGNLSNPPPSPEASEKSPEYKSLPINLVSNDTVDLTEKPSTSHAAVAKELQTYEDDFLDVNCGDMDFF
ncbi:phosphorylated adapter RNA export protein [Stomoxys calcitrans]|uniref:phosphorylated adapter RNA export protein n=1 Tax=Stomoxys calcitrans TaxID=35570 RepID=UPI0027E2ADBA|nr:phosphorylated adapter RNA export protein [Stomoxys calcitrans]